jgi:uncharacterized membrane protein YciS (DUF1049 family)
MCKPVNLVIGFLALLAAFIIVVFVVANRTPVQVSFSPLPYDPVWHVWFVVLVFFGAGTLLGGLFVWANAHKSRKISAQRKRRIKVIEKELAASQTQIGSLEADARMQIAAQRSVAMVEDQSAA